MKRPIWSDHYPDPLRLKREVLAAADTFITALREVVPKGELSGIYVKGSAVKRWDSPLDYVPWLSDVDVHVLFKHDAGAVRHFGSVEKGLALSRRAEALYLSEIPAAIHVPRIQMVNANKLYSEPNYIPSPIETVQLRFGKRYPERDLDPDRSRESAIASTLLPENVTFLAKLGDAVTDLTGPHLRRTLRDLSWRVSPTGPRTLELKGVPFMTAWTGNRSLITSLLETVDEGPMAASYADFYIQAWDYFLSGDADGEPARRAILAASRVLVRGMGIARESERL